VEVHPKGIVIVALEHFKLAVISFPEGDGQIAQVVGDFELVVENFWFLVIAIADDAGSRYTVIQLNRYTISFISPRSHTG